MAGIYTWDKLEYDNALPFITETVTLLTGSTYKRGDVLGEVTASGKYTLSDSTAVDGSEVAKRILHDTTVDATTGDVIGVVYKMGRFTFSALTLGAGHTLATIKDDLYSQNIDVIDEEVLV
jgi:hypothetical protein